MCIRDRHSPYRFSFALANGVTEYPGWGVSGENTPAFGPTGGWKAWWLGSTAPTLPPQTSNSIAWVYGSGAVQYFYARDPKYDPTKADVQALAPRIREVSALMDSTNPDLSVFHARGGKLILLENMADYAQSPFAGIRYFDSVIQKLGREKVDQFFALFTAPGVDHVGSGAPSNVDMLSALVDWVERGKAPANLELVEQDPKLPFAIKRSRPLCEWPKWPRYRSGDASQSASFVCTP